MLARGHLASRTSLPQLNLELKEKGQNRHRVINIITEKGQVKRLHLSRVKRACSPPPPPYTLAPSNEEEKLKPIGHAIISP